MLKQRRDKHKTADTKLEAHLILHLFSPSLKIHNVYNIIWLIIKPVSPKTITLNHNDNKTVLMITQVGCRIMTPRKVPVNNVTVMIDYLQSSNKRWNAGDVTPLSLLHSTSKKTLQLYWKAGYQESFSSSLCVWWETQYRLWNLTAGGSSEERGGEG